VKSLNEFLAENKKQKAQYSITFDVVDLLKKGKSLADALRDTIGRIKDGSAPKTSEVLNDIVKNFPDVAKKHNLKEDFLTEESKSEKQEVEKIFNNLDQRKFTQMIQDLVKKTGSSSKVKIQKNDIKFFRVSDEWEVSYVFVVGNDELFISCEFIGDFRKEKWRFDVQLGTDYLSMYMIRGHDLLIKALKSLKFINTKDLLDSIKGEMKT
jgi:hypothetical protein